MLRHGLEASDVGPAGEAVAEAIDARLRTGRPLAADEWIRAQEKALSRKLAPGKRGPKPAGHGQSSGINN
jgi:putative transposase